MSHPPRLSHDQLCQAQADTLATARRPYCLAARVLFVTLDLVYGRARTLSKFRVLELVARVPYQACEQTAYISITHAAHRVGVARCIFERVLECRAQQDNEQWHLFILEDLLGQSRQRESWLMSYWIPQLIALVYYQLSWLLYAFFPGASYLLNADFEDHAEHEYMHFVQEHPEWETTPFEFPFTEDYGHYASLADVFRQIGHDERVHKLESEARLARRASQIRQG